MFPGVSTSTDDLPLDPRLYPVPARRGSSLARPYRKPGQPVVDTAAETRHGGLRELVSGPNDRLVDRDETCEIDGGGGDDDVGGAEDGIARMVPAGVVGPECVDDDDVQVGTEEREVVVPAVPGSGLAWASRRLPIRASSISPTPGGLTPPPA
jgi:hypothetical protein